MQPRNMTHRHTIFLFFCFNLLIFSSLTAQDILTFRDGSQISGKLVRAEIDAIYFAINGGDGIPFARKEIAHLILDPSIKRSSATTGRKNTATRTNYGEVDVTDVLILKDDFRIEGRLKEIYDTEVLFCIRGNNDQWFDRSNIKMIRIGTQPRIRQREFDDTYLTFKQRKQQNRVENKTPAWISLTPTALSLPIGQVFVRNADLHQSELTFVLPFFRGSAGLTGLRPTLRAQGSLPFFQVFSIGAASELFFPKLGQGDDEMIESAQLAWSPILTIGNEKRFANFTYRTRAPFFLPYVVDGSNWIFGETKTVGGGWRVNSSLQILAEVIWILDERAEKHHRYYAGVNLSGIRTTLGVGLAMYDSPTDFGGDLDFLSILNGTPILPSAHFVFRVF